MTSNIEGKIEKDQMMLHILRNIIVLNIWIVYHNEYQEDEISGS